MTVSALDLRARVARPIRKAIGSDFVRHSALVFGATMAVNICNYLFNFALSRRLGIEGFATLSALVSFLMILSIPMTILSLMIVKYSGAYNAGGDTQRIRRLSQVLLKWTSVGGVGLFAVGALLRNEIAEFLHIQDDAAILLCLAVLAVGVVTPSVRSVLQGEQDFKRFCASMLLEVLIKVPLAVALVYAGFGVAGAMTGWIAGTACALVYTVWAVLRKHGPQTRTDVPLGIDWSELLRTTAGVGLATGFLTFISFMDVLLVKHYFDAHEAGLYAAVNLTGKVVLFVVAFVPAVVLPKAVAKKASGDNPIPLLLQALAVTVLISGAVLSLFGSFPDEVLRALVGRDFLSAAPLVLQYDGAICLLAILTLVVNFRIGVHRFEFLYPLGAVLIGEVMAISLFHRSLFDVVHILLAGNAIAAGACCYRPTKDSQGGGVQVEALEANA